MEKELAIEVEIKEVFKEKYAWNIKNCNLPFNDYYFEDKEMNIKIEYFKDNKFRGTYKLSSYDYPCIILSDDVLINKETKEKLLFLIKNINKKYTRINGPRVERGKVYFYLDDTFKVSQQIDANELRDFERYRLGNYFKTFDEAKEASKPFKELWYKITYGDNYDNN